jgi:hypothetical protein
MLWALVSSAYVIYLYRKLNAEAATPIAVGGPGPANIDAAVDTLDRRLSALDARLTGLQQKESVR